ncbi:SDR family oxidoreductase [Usitatibacter palustris]|uniref:Putative oxidoreductase n=1 Tax=Usitatibacter palustris TaxID=2732487 RepID=A0A6M4HBH5_9PROT|nr:SDR family oxidoreductase [Usitatibacter palustris]QJR16931.1 putative oxidoreductase [Usitatibacter palustris]
MRVFLTGASSGIGEALARYYASRGASLGLLARRADFLANLKSSLGVAVEVYPCDVRDLAAVKAAAEDFTARQGLPDIVIANAGISHGTLVENESDVDTFRQIMDINVMGIVNAFHPFIEPMRARGSGTLVGIASVAGYRGFPGAGAYSASKAAAIRFCEAQRLELRGTGVKVVTICPGYIETPMTEKNPYPMPFLMPVEKFVTRCGRAIDSGTSLAVIPWQMAIVARLLTILPNALFDAVFSRAGRKPRAGH